MLKILNAIVFIIGSSLLLMSSSVASTQPTTPGWYINGAGGIGSTDFEFLDDDFNIEIDDDYFIKSNSETNRKLALRLEVGYMFNPYVGIAIGGNYINPKETTAYGFYQIDDSKELLYKLKKYARDFDVLAKTGVPLGNFNVYTKEGFAYVRSKIRYTDPQFPEFNTTYKSSLMRPLLGIGASYYFTNNLGITLEYMHIFKKGDVDDIDDVENFGSKEFSPTMEQVTLGIIYHF